MFGQTMVELGKENEKICAITAAMPDGTGLLQFRDAYPSAPLMLALRRSMPFLWPVALPNKGWCL
jgi:hypothetical protein